MARISFDRTEIQALHTMLVERGEDEVALAKDQGCYLCSLPKKDMEPLNTVVYAKGMNPAVDDDWYEEARYKVGGDDFGVYLPTQWLEIFLTHPHYKNKKVMALNIGARSISLAK